MKLAKQLLSLTIVMISFAAHAGDHGTDFVGDTFCSDSNKGAILSVLENEQRASASEGLERVIRSVAIGETQVISRDLLMSEGVSAAQADQIMMSLKSLENQN